MKPFFIIALWITALQVCLAQNLVPDSSFENNKFTPMDFSGLNASYHWSLPSRGTSDLFCKCSRKAKLAQDKLYSQVDVPQNPMGYQQAHSGTCYAGVFLFSHGNYREYLQTQLSAPLQKGKTYLFSMYISLADYSGASIDQLGVCFLKNESTYLSTEVIADLNPNYIPLDTEVGNEVDDWHLLTLQYKAVGGERYLLLGSFVVNKIRRTKLKAPKEIKSRINQETERDAYYFIDDVSVIEIIPEDDAQAPTEPEFQAPAYPIRADSLLVLKNVLFETNASVLLESSYAELNQIVMYLKEHPESKVSIFGHTDNSGKETSNLKLSEDRARAVAEYLESESIEASRLTYKGYGSLKPLSTNTTAERRKLNRRVEFIIK